MGRADRATTCAHYLSRRCVIGVSFLEDGDGDLDPDGFKCRENTVWRFDFLFG
jgi:hypothetical protein